jgi:hypothetical protein
VAVVEKTAPSIDALHLTSAGGYQTAVHPLWMVQINLRLHDCSARLGAGHGSFVLRDPEIAAATVIDSCSTRCRFSL